MKNKRRRWTNQLLTERQSRITNVSSRSCDAHISDGIVSQCRADSHRLGSRVDEKLLVVLQVLAPFAVAVGLAQVNSQGNESSQKDATQSHQDSYNGRMNQRLLYCVALHFLTVGCGWIVAGGPDKHRLVRENQRRFRNPFLV